MSAPPGAGPDLPPQPDVRSRYRGAEARDYLERRQRSTKWDLENSAVDGILQCLPRAALILDAPVGTGRFLAAYARHSHRYLGIDVSPEMLAQARDLQRQPAESGGNLVRADVLTLPLAEGAVDHVLSARLLNWFDVRQLEEALAEFRRVSRGELIVEVRLSRSLGWRQVPGLLGELLRHPLASLRRLARSLRPPADGAVLRLHDERDFHRILARLGLKVDRTVQIADGTAYSRRLLRHTPLRFFVLSQSNADG
jgi:SAM-dependent methyltransferase